MICHEEVEDAVRAECGCGFCRLCVTEYIESSVAGEGAASGCPKCGRPLTVDLSKKEGEGQEEEGNENGNARGKKRAAVASASNRAGSVVCVAGKVKLQGLDRKSILHRIQLENFQSSTKLEALLEELNVMQVGTCVCGREGVRCLPDWCMD